MLFFLAAVCPAEEGETYDIAFMKKRELFYNIYCQYIALALPLSSLKPKQKSCFI
jgi:hypothetical protein